MKKKIGNEHLKGATNAVIGKREDWLKKHSSCEKMYTKSVVCGSAFKFIVCNFHSDVWIEKDLGGAVIESKIVDVNGDAL